MSTWRFCLCALLAVAVMCTAVSSVDAGNPSTSSSSGVAWGRSAPAAAPRASNGPSVGSAGASQKTPVAAFQKPSVLPGAAAPAPAKQSVPGASSGQSTAGNPGGTVRPTTTGASGAFVKPGTVGTAGAPNMPPPGSAGGGAAQSTSTSTPPAFAKPATAAASPVTQPRDPITGRFVKREFSTDQPGGAAVVTGSSGRPQIQPTSAYTDALKKQRAAAAQKEAQQVAAARQSPVVASTIGNQTYNNTTIINARTTYYDSQPVYRANYARYESWGWRDRNSYGGLDPSFMMAMAMSDDPGNAAVWYSLTGSPVLALLMSQTKEKAKEHNDPVLLARIERIEQENAALKARGVAPQPVHVALQQAKIPPEVALTKAVLTNEPDVTPTLTFGTGGLDGTYYAFCGKFKDVVGQSLNVVCEPSGGSKENLVSVVSAKSQCVLAQSDVIDSVLKQNASVSFGPYQMSAYSEEFWLIVNDNSGINSVKDLDPKKHTLLMGGSGAAASWDALALYAKNSMLGYNKYAEFKTETVDREAGLSRVANDKNSVMLVVMGLNSPFLKRANDVYGDKLKLAAFDDGSFDNLTDREGNYIYHFVTLPGGTYKKLQSGWLSTSVETLSVQAVVVCNSEAVESLGDAAENVVLTGLNFVIPEMRKETSGVY